MTSYTNSPQGPLRSVGGQDYRFVPTYLRSRDPITPASSPDIKPKEQQGYYPISSLWTNTSNQNVWVLAGIISNLAKWVLISAGGAGPLIHIGVPNGTSPIDPDVNGLVNFTSTLGTITITGSAGGVGLQNINFDLVGGGVAIDQINVDANTPPGTDPVLPTATGQITITGGQVATGTIGTNVIRTDSLAANTFTIEIQRSTAVAVTDLTKNGVSHFDSARFTVDANGFVSVNGSGIGETITGDSGGALSPTAGNWNILGRSGSKTSGSGSTLTISSPPFTDQAGSTTVTLNSGSFATNAITLTTPATAGLADGDLVEFVATNGALVIQMNTGQVGHLGTSSTSSGGTFTGSTSGDALVLRWQSSTADWWATSSIGTWVLA